MTSELQALLGITTLRDFSFSKVTRVSGQKELQSELRLFDRRQKREEERSIPGLPSVFLYWRPKGCFQKSSGTTVIMFPSRDNTSPSKTTK